MQRIRTLLQRANLPIQAPAQMNSKQFMDLMAVDKKVQDGQLRLILMRSMGVSVITSEASSEQIVAMLERHLSGS